MLYLSLAGKKSTFPRFVFLDGPSSSLHLAIAQFRKEKKIHSYCFPAHFFRIMQPMDTCVFRPEKRTWNDALYNNTA